MKKLLWLEGQLTRVETAFLVFFVLVMLILAGYNVFYRNVLVPLQANAATSGPPVVETAPPKSKTPEKPAPGTTPAPTEKGGDSEGFGGGFGDDGDDSGGFGGGFGDDDDKATPKPADDTEGFGGGFGEDDEADNAEDKPKPATETPKSTDETEGFGGGFGEDDEADNADDKPRPTPKPPEPAKPADETEGFGGGFGEDDEADNADKKPEAAEPADEAGGFGGGFGDDDEAPKKDDAEGFGGGFGDDNDDGDDDEGFGGGFGDDGDTAEEATADKTAKAADAPTPVTAPKVLGGPPAEGSFAAGVVWFVDELKLEWIDVLLRQLVLICGFLGATLATRRKKHINIDAVSRFLPRKMQRWTNVVTNAASAIVCVVLALAGIDFVKIGLEFPREIMWWAKEWAFQLVFPIGFGLLALHFMVRVAEAGAIALGMTKEDDVDPPPPSRPDIATGEAPSPLTEGGAA